jgi:hypothetical protein
MTTATLAAATAATNARHNITRSWYQERRIRAEVYARRPTAATWSPQKRANAAYAISTAASA